MACAWFGNAMPPFGRRKYQHSCSGYARPIAGAWRNSVCCTTQYKWNVYDCWLSRVFPPSRSIVDVEQGCSPHYRGLAAVLFLVLKGWCWIFWHQPFISLFICKTSQKSQENENASNSCWKPIILRQKDDSSSSSFWHRRDGNNDGGSDTSKRLPELFDLWPCCLGVLQLLVLTTSLG